MEASGRVRGVKSVPGPAVWLFGWVGGFVRLFEEAERPGGSDVLLKTVLLPLPENNTGLNKLAGSGAGSLLSPLSFFFFF